jgi:hypothetical protein
LLRDGITALVCATMAAWEIRRHWPNVGLKSQTIASTVRAAYFAVAK